jgi:hypothetical protein
VRDGAEILARSLRFACNSYISRVEPRGFEPLTSAVQRRLNRSAEVHRRSENRLHKRPPTDSQLSLFADVHPGNCQVTVSDTGTCPTPSVHLNGGRYQRAT